MKTIQLTQGKVALVDDEDFEELIKYKWYASKVKTTNKFYVRRNIKIEGGKQKTVRIHSVIINTPKGLYIDHIDGDGLNNQKSNLRVCSNAENARNRGANLNNTSGYKGVTWHKRMKKWVVQITVDYERKVYRSFSSKEEAYLAYCDACVTLHREFSNVGTLSTV